MQDKQSVGTQPQFIISPNQAESPSFEQVTQDATNKRGSDVRASDFKMHKQQLQQTQFSIPLPDGILSPEADRQGAMEH